MYKNKEEKGVKLKVCELCGQQKDDVVSCRMCGIHFCGEDGYTDKNLCFSCGDETEESMEDEADDTLVDETEPKPKQGKEEENEEEDLEE